MNWELDLMREKLRMQTELRWKASWKAPTSKDKYDAGR
jgi:hypothetical protein